MVSDGKCSPGTELKGRLPLNSVATSQWHWDLMAPENRGGCRQHWVLTPPPEAAMSPPEPPGLAPRTQILWVMPLHSTLVLRHQGVFKSPNFVTEKLVPLRVRPSQHAVHILSHLNDVSLGTLFSCIGSQPLLNQESPPFISQSDKQRAIASCTPCF